MHKLNERRTDLSVARIKKVSSQANTKPNNCLRTIDQLSHDIVSDWVSDNSIQVRPSEKAALKALIARQVLQYIAADTKRSPDLSPDFHFERGRLACIEAIANLNEEPFIGFICKQRALNACVQTPDEVEADVKES